MLKTTLVAAVAALSMTATSALASTFITFEADKGHLEYDAYGVATSWVEEGWRVMRYDFPMTGVQAVDVSGGVFHVGVGEHAWIVRQGQPFDIVKFDYAGADDLIRIVNPEWDLANLGKEPGTQSNVSGSWGARFYSSSSFTLDNFSMSVVPEPSTWAMMITGFGLIGGQFRKRRAYTALT